MNVASYVQTRGSITLIWSMKPNLKWAPPVRIMQSFDSSMMAATNHVKKTKQMYGDQYWVNLIDKKGS